MNISIYTLIYQLITFSANFIQQEQQFRQFIKVYNKNYTFNSSEYWHRFTIFQRSIEKIKNLNNQRKHPNSALFGLTPFTDLTLTEFKSKVIKTIGKRYKQRNDVRGSKRLLLSSSQYNGNNLTNQDDGDLSMDKIIKTLPPQVDWRSKGIIGNVIAQGKCGSCWAHTVTETISSMVAMETNKFTRLSAQQLLDCSDNNYGCNGGDLCEALNWIVKNNVTLLKETDYPLRLDSGQCRQPNITNGVQIESNFTCHRQTGHEENMLQLIANHGPLMAAADASIWQHYVNGTIHENCGQDANHAVQIVGYNLQDDIPYYIARNTWGTNWGMDGYLQIAIGNNTCDITAEVSAVWIKSID